MKAIRTEKKTRKYKSVSGVKLQKFKRLNHKENIHSLNFCNYYKYYEKD